MTPQLRAIEDADLITATFAMPGGASTTVNSANLDLGAFSKGTASVGGSGIRPPKVEVALETPAFDATMVPDTRTQTLFLLASDDATFASGVRTLASVVLTGAGGVGVAAYRLQAPIPGDCPRYVRGRVTSGASTTTAAAVSGIVKLRF